MPQSPALLPWGNVRKNVNLLGEVNKRAAGSYYTESLFGPRTRAVVGALLRLGAHPIGAMLQCQGSQVRIGSQIPQGAR